MREREPDNSLQPSDRGHRYRNCRGMAINMLVEKLCREEEVGYVDLWGSFVGSADMYMKDGPVAWVA